MRDDPLDRANSGRLMIGPGAPVGHEHADQLLDDARRRVRESEDEDRERTLTARRLMAAFVLTALMAVLSFVLLPKWGIYLPPMIPALGFLVILIGTILGGRGPGGEPRVVDKRCGCDDDGQPICCGGPRPMRSFRDQ